MSMFEDPLEDVEELADWQLTPEQRELRAYLHAARERDRRIVVAAAEDPPEDPDEDPDDDGNEPEPVHAWRWGDVPRWR